MNLFENFFRGGNGAEVKKLHPKFRFHEGFWYFNQLLNPYAPMPTVKVRFSFDDPSLLDDCPFMAKIGSNQDSSMRGSFIGFAYGGDADVETLVSWAQKFNSAELIVGLDKNAVSTPESVVTNIKEGE